MIIQHPILNSYQSLLNIWNNFFGSRDRRGTLLAGHGAFEGGASGVDRSSDGDGEGEGTGDQPSCFGCTVMKSFCPFWQ